MADTKEQWFLTNPACMKDLLRVIEICITGARYIPAAAAPPDPKPDPNKRKTIIKPEVLSAFKSSASSLPIGTTYVAPTDRIRVS